MGSPLDDLRKISTQVERKKTDTIKNISERDKLERKMLSENSREEQQQRVQKSDKTVKRSQRIKSVVLLSVFLIAACLMFFIVRYIFFGASISRAKIELLSDDFVVMGSDDSEYDGIFSFIEKFIGSYKKDPEKIEIPWYHGLSLRKRGRYKEVLDKRIQNPGLSLRQINHNKKTQSFKVWYENGSEAPLVINLFYNKNSDLKIIKIY